MTDSWNLKDKQSDGIEQTLNVERFVHEMAEANEIPKGVSPANYIEFLKTAETVAFQNFKKQKLIQNYLLLLIKILKTLQLN